MGSNILRNWFVPKDGINRSVITADIQKYLGNDATVRPGKDKEVGNNMAYIAHMTFNNKSVDVTDMVTDRGLLDQSVQKPHFSMSPRRDLSSISLTYSSGNDQRHPNGLNQVGARTAFRSSRYALSFHAILRLTLTFTKALTKSRTHINRLPILESKVTVPIIALAQTRLSSAVMSTFLPMAMYLTLPHGCLFRRCLPMRIPDGCMLLHLIPRLLLLLPTETLLCIPPTNPGR